MLSPLSCIVAEYLDAPLSISAQFERMLFRGAPDINGEHMTREKRLFGLAAQYSPNLRSEPSNKPPISIDCPTAEMLALVALLKDDQTLAKVAQTAKQDVVVAAFGLACEKATECSVLEDFCRVFDLSPRVALDIGMLRATKCNNARVVEHLLKNTTYARKMVDVRLAMAAATKAGAVAVLRMFVLAGWQTMEFFELSVDENQLESFEFLLKRNSRDFRECLNYVAANGTKRMMETMTSSPQALSRSPGDYEGALATAIEARNTEVVEFLIGAFVKSPGGQLTANALVDEDEESSLLTRAIVANCPRLVQQLLMIPGTKVFDLSLEKAAVVGDLDLFRMLLACHRAPTKLIPSVVRESARHASHGLLQFLLDFWPIYRATWQDALVASIEALRFDNLVRLTEFGQSKDWEFPKTLALNAALLTGKSAYVAFCVEQGCGIDDTDPRTVNDALDREVCDETFMDVVEVL